MDEAHKKIHLVIVLPSFILGGGIESHLLKMMPLFDRARYRLSLLTLFEYPERPNLYDSLPKDVHTTRLAFRGPWDMRSWKKLYEAFRQLRPDIVMSSMFSAHIRVLVLKPFLGYRVITREHNTYTDKRWYHHVADHLFSYLADAIVAVSSAVADFILKQAWIPRYKISVIHNGVDVEAIASYRESAEADVRRVRDELGLADNQKIVLNVARLKPQKNQELLIRAFHRFAEHHPHHVLVILGEGSERSRLEQLIQELNCGTIVRLMGRRTDVYAFYAASDFSVLTSYHEGFPNVGLEAMAFGLPFISTHVPGVDEFIEDGKNGYIVPSTTEGVVHALEILSEHSSEERMAWRETCVKTAQRFDIRDVVKRYALCIEGVLER